MDALKNCLGVRPHDEASAMSKPAFSRRANELMAHVGDGGFIELMMRLFDDQYSKENPGGIVNLGIAENSLMHEWLTKYYNDTFRLTYEDFTYGDSPNGSKRLFDGLCKLYNKRLSPVKEIRPEHLYCGVGASAVIDQLTMLLCNEGEGIMIARPYYNGFDDLGARNGAVPIGVALRKDVDPSSPDTLEAFEKTFAACSKKGPKPRAVILCNPQNPLGFCYPKETILAYLHFCQKHNLHLIVDEIYALSCYRDGPFPFTSVLSIDVEKEARCDPTRVHVVTGMSKDFCANGFRIGIAISQYSKDLAKAWMAPIILMKTGSPSELMWAHLLHDEEALDHFLSENKRRLAASYSYTCEWLDKHDIPFRPAHTGHFVWADFRKEMPTHDKDGKKLENDSDRAQALFMQFVDESRVYVGPASIYHGEPGFFRITMSVRRDYLDVGLNRLAKTLEANRERRNSGPERALMAGQRAAAEEEDVRKGLMKLGTA